MLPLVILGGALYYLSRPRRNPPASAEEIENRKQEIAVLDERLAQQRRRLNTELNAIDRRDIQRYGRTLLTREGTPELMAAQEAIKRLQAARQHAHRELIEARYRNPVVRANMIDKAEQKVRRLADAARGSMASPQSKAAYRRALDELMQLRIDAGTQGTLFDVAPRQTTQRGLPGLFD